MLINKNFTLSSSQKFFLYIDIEKLIYVWKIRSYFQLTLGRMKGLEPECKVVKWQEEIVWLACTINFKLFNNEEIENVESFLNGNPFTIYIQTLK